MPTPIAASTIAAQAFRELEMAPISSFADDSEQAAAASEQYPQALNMCLAAADWGFASVFHTLSASDQPTDSTIDPDLPQFYTLLGDVIVLREVGDRYTRWRQDRDGLRSDTGAPLRIRYTGTVSDEASLPARFQLAVALHLASLLAPRWLGTASKVQDLSKRAGIALKQAAREFSRSASDARYDGLDEQDDWVAEARA
jgi:hypothetical protein